jgi:hypothetical protein
LFEEPLKEFSSTDATFTGTVQKPGAMLKSLGKALKNEWKM